MLMCKMVLLQFLYYLSDPEMEAQVAFNLVYKWFLGVSAEKAPPDFSSR
ncbi:MAG: transposase [Desulfobaccales bacterium]